MCYKSNDLFDCEERFEAGVMWIYQHFFQRAEHILFSQSDMHPKGCIEDPVPYPIRWIRIKKMIELKPEVSALEHMKIDRILPHDP